MGRSRYRRRAIAAITASGYFIYGRPVSGWSFVFLPRLLLAVCLLGFHLGAAEAPGEAETDVAAVGGALADGGVVGVDAAAAGADGAKEVVDVEEEGQAAVEEVGTHAAVEGEIGVDLGQWRLGAAAIDGVGEELQAVEPAGRRVFKNLCPEVKSQRVAEHLALLPHITAVVGRADTTVLHTVVVVEEVGVEPNIHEIQRPQGGVEADAALPCVADVGGLGEGDDAPEAVAVGHVGEGTGVVAVGVVPRAEADAAEVVEVAFPTKFQIVGIAFAQRGIAVGVGVVAIDGEACELRGGGRRDVVGVAEGEVMHRLGAVADVDGGAEGEVMLAHIAAVGIRVVEVVPGVVHRQRGTEGEAAEVVLGADVRREFVGAIGVGIAAK